jgi:hypothetical protein
MNNLRHGWFRNPIRIIFVGHCTIVCASDMETSHKLAIWISLFFLAQHMRASRRPLEGAATEPGA